MTKPRSDVQHMRADVQLRMDGNSRVLTIPRLMCTYLGWLPGDRFVVEITDNKTLLIRPLTPADFMPRAHARVVYDYTEPQPE